MAMSRADAPFLDRHEREKTMKEGFKYVVT